MEELANLELANSTIGARAYGNAEAGIADILSNLKSDNEIEAYGQTGNTTITGITFGQAVEQNGIELEIGATNAVVKAATFTSSDPSQDYWVQIRGKKHPIGKINGVIKITKTEIITGTNPTGEITSVEVSPTGVVEAKKVSGTTDKIRITGLAKGTATVTVKYTDEMYTTIAVRVEGYVTVSTQAENTTDNEDVGTIDPSISEQVYAEGSSISLTAEVTNNDYQFVGWYETKDSGTETQKSTNASYTYTVPNDGTATVVLKAKFEEKPQTLGTSASDTGVGCYIRKGSEYAIVFADRVAQAGTTVTYNSSEPKSVTGGSFCVFPPLDDEEKTGFKTYRVTGTYTDSHFGTGNVLEVVNDTGEDRFMALALSDLATNGPYYVWYNAACQKMTEFSSTGGTDQKGSPTSRGFLKGKTNTETMINKWNNKAYGKQDTNSSGRKDVWGQIQSKAEEGWFVPSYEEWSAFAWAMSKGKLKKGIGSYDSLGLNAFNWSSSQASSGYAWYTTFNSGYMHANEVTVETCIRLATTF